ncbi:acetoacetate-CoA ligase [Hysterangium stoloniferum]|nr:acetoacetate-CoA ligase [Hysterangium stoloniferum]
MPLFHGTLNQDDNSQHDTNDKPLWSPPVPRATRTFSFRNTVNERHALSLSSYQDLYTWSIKNIADFWSLVWDETGVIGSKGTHVVDSTASPADNPPWFTDARINWAENMLRCRSGHTALISATEPTLDVPKPPVRSLSYAHLYQLVADVVSALLLIPIVPGDRVASYSSNCLENVACCLATTALGGIWISAAADFGPDGVLERFQQVKPKVIFSVDEVVYNAKVHPHLSKLSTLLDGLRKNSVVPAKVVIIPLSGADRSKWRTGWVAWQDFVDEGASRKLGRDDSGEILWRRGSFNWPLWILFSSGTTGLPKPIVHRAGGNRVQEHIICSELDSSDVFFYYTSCGWMMYNYLISGLAAGCTLVLYDGSPLHTKSYLWDLVDSLGITVFGTSAKYLHSLSSVYRPREHHDLSTLRHIYSTGSPLPGALYDFIYQHIHPNVLVGSITGGTDICSLFAGQCTALPVFRGEIQCRMLGMAIEAFSREGTPVPHGEAGELVCLQPFPCQPIGFWPLPSFGDDISVEEARKLYEQAYFKTFKDVWYHGDHVIISKSKEGNGGGVIMLGRSDSVLNPGGVRFGSSEIYDVVEQYFSESLPSISPSHIVYDALAIGQSVENGTDERVILFVKLGHGVTLGGELIKAISTQIRTSRSARHVPARIIQVKDIPYTLNGKRIEVPVKKMINGATLNSVNLSTLRNPECLEEYEAMGVQLREELASEPIV